MFAEFAIALPLLILLGWGLASVGVKIFELGKNQLADYVLEEEVHDVLSRLIYDARAAKIIKKENDITLIFTYRTVNEIRAKDGNLAIGDVIADKEEHRIYMVAGKKIHYKRSTEYAAHPITGNNYFGETEVETFDFEFDATTKILHVTLELKSKVTDHKIKMSTAVYASGCES